MLHADRRNANTGSDNGTELTSLAILRWAQECAVDWHYIAPGKSTQNAFIESFNGRLPSFDCRTKRCVNPSKSI